MLQNSLFRLLIPTSGGAATSYLKGATRRPLAQRPQRRKAPPSSTAPSKAQRAALKALLVFVVMWFFKAFFEIVVGEWLIV